MYANSGDLYAEAGGPAAVADVADRQPADRTGKARDAALHPDPGEGRHEGAATRGSGEVSDLALHTGDLLPELVVFFPEDIQGDAVIECTGGAGEPPTDLLLTLQHSQQVTPVTGHCGLHVIMIQGAHEHRRFHRWFSFAKPCHQKQPPHEGRERASKMPGLK